LSRFSSLKGIYENIRIVARAVGEVEKAEMMIAKMKVRLREIEMRIPEKSARPVLLSYDVSGWTAGADTTFDALVSLAGGRNLAAESGIVGHKKISLETVVAFNPEVMIFNTWAPDAGRSNATLMKNPALQSVAAVQTGRLHGVPGKHLTTVSHYIVEGVEAMARLLYPKVFAANQP
jgi:iron complex transport system substrate-binding protein